MISDLFQHPLLKPLAAFLYPRSTSEDDIRKEFILNLLLTASIFLSGFAFMLVLRDALILGDQHRGASPFYVGGACLFFIVLYLLSRLKLYKISAYALVALYYLAGTYTLATWGILIANGWIIYILTMLLAAILITSRVALYTVVILIGTAATITYLHATETLVPNYYWLHEKGSYDDLVTYGVLFGVITVVFWLSNREIDKSLARARASERALKQQRDSLETTVQQRTKELIENQRQEMLQFYRFAELGKLSTNLIHDLISPLTSVSLNLKQLPDSRRSELVRRALLSISSMERFIDSARRQMSHQQVLDTFKPAEEIELAAHVLEVRARGAGVAVRLELDRNLETYGDPIKFHKLVLNVLLNSLDAFQGIRRKDKRVLISLTHRGSAITLQVKDNGKGIPKDLVEHVFTPFFTTKERSQGIGMGLAIVKEIAEEDFHGTIKLSSTEKKGTTVAFTFKQQWK